MTGNVTLQSGGQITGNLTLLQATNLSIDGTSKIDVSGKGYAGGAATVNGYGPGAGQRGYPNSNIGGGGAGYGGVGGNGQNKNATYGAGGVENGQANIHQPTEFGSGGGGSAYLAPGGAGGGAIKLNISGTLDNSGSIFSNGGNGILDGFLNYYSSGAGSGGSIWIQAGTISGAGTVTANGGAGVNAVNADGGGGAGGRIAISGAGDLAITASGGTSFATAGGTGSIYYSASGTYTSAVLDFLGGRDFTTVDITKATPGTSTAVVSLHGGNTNNPAEWADNWAVINDNDNISTFDNFRYLQYKVELSFTGLSTDPKPNLQDISFNYYTYLNKSLTSSIYNSNSDANTFASISWEEDFPSDTVIKFQMQTSADNSTWSDFMGPDGTNATYFYTGSGCTKTDSLVTCDLDNVPNLGESENNHYFKYKAYLISETGVDTPALNSVTVTYVVNANPEIEANQTTAVPDANKKVNISYNVRDTDSISGTITPSFEYSLNGGSSWTAITSGCLEATDLDAKTISTPATPPENTTYTPHTATWTPACESGIGTTTYEA
ncbi:MAG: hypothetical protein US30_C0002G0001, partial [Candidatus Moranbacteria bacterium GW2011_GWF2_36_839]